MLLAPSKGGLMRRIAIVFLWVASLLTMLAPSGVPAGAATQPSPRATTTTNGRIVFSEFTDGSIQSWDIRSIHPNGTNDTWLSDVAFRYEVGPQVSPDGQLVAVEFEDHVMVMNIDGSGKRLLTSGSSSREWNIRWSPDGSRLAFFSDRSGDYHIWTVPIAGGAATDVMPTLTSADIGGFAWSPDSTRLAFGGWDSSIQTEDLYTVKPDGTHLRHVTHSNDYPDGITWSPDGTTIVYGSNLQLWTVHPDGTGHQRLDTDFTAKYDPLWSPTGDAILYLAYGTDAGRSLWLMDPDGTNPRSLLSGGTVVDDASWSPDGALIVFRGVQDRGEGEIYKLVPLPSATATRLTFNKVDDRDPSWAPGCGVTGTIGDDLLEGTAGDDFICGGNGNDVIRGLGGDDVLLGGAGADRLLGGDGADVVAGEAGFDRLSGGGGDDTVNGSDGVINEQVAAGNGQDRCRAEKRDVLTSCELVESFL
jgi:Tol biopolymer transport system component